MNALHSLLTLHQAASILNLDVRHILGMCLVVTVTKAGARWVPTWSVKPQVVRVTPLLSEHFKDDALVYCLSIMQPYKDGRNGIDVLVDGEHKLVLSTLARMRTALDQHRARVMSKPFRWIL